MASQMIVQLQLPVTDLDRSRMFFAALGFGVHRQLTDENALCLVVGPSSLVMLIEEKVFTGFAGGRRVADTATHIETIVAVTVDSREAVDRHMTTALDHGATETRRPEDHGSMYARSFIDPDGHTWDLVWLDPAIITVEQG